MVTLSFELMGMMDFAGRNNRQAGAAHFRGNGRWQRWQAHNLPQQAAWFAVDM